MRGLSRKERLVLNPLAFDAPALIVSPEEWITIWHELERVGRVRLDAVTIDGERVERARRTELGLLALRVCPTEEKET